jgi:hypothetical protein
MRERHGSLMDDQVALGGVIIVGNEVIGVLRHWTVDMGLTIYSVCWGRQRSCTA